MSQKPRLLDLFCGAGGATKGYQCAGFYVVGVDIKPQPRYCGDEFVQADAMTFPLDGFDVIHASPPCQKYSWSAKRWPVERQDLLVPIRRRLESTGRPWVIENVIGAVMRSDALLCGTMFGLGVIRHRRFESNVSLFDLLPPCRHDGTVRNGDYVTVAGHGGDGQARLSLWREAMGIDWMTRLEIVEAIPPAYTEFIGRQLLAYLQDEAA